ncbi:hypothetical protein DFJ74DRAFT_304118 [Hyaloraphidium curvatum]|nr:hypothetical protein DFJ74DRAFT_304118 [Hyaloraphidium curvatum]
MAVVSRDRRSLRLLVVLLLFPFLRLRVLLPAQRFPRRQRDPLHQLLRHPPQAPPLDPPRPAPSVPDVGREPFILLARAVAEHRRAEERVRGVGAVVEQQADHAPQAGGGRDVRGAGGEGDRGGEMRGGGGMPEAGEDEVQGAEDAGALHGVGVVELVGPEEERVDEGGAGVEVAPGKGGGEEEGALEEAEGRGEMLEGEISPAWCVIGRGVHDGEKELGRVGRVVAPVLVEVRGQLIHELRRSVRRGAESHLCRQRAASSRAGKEVWDPAGQPEVELHGLRESGDHVQQPAYEGICPGHVLKSPRRRPFVGVEQHVEQHGRVAAEQLHQRAPVQVALQQPAQAALRLPVEELGDHLLHVLEGAELCAAPLQELERVVVGREHLGLAGVGPAAPLLSYLLPREESGGERGEAVQPLGLVEHRGGEDGVVRRPEEDLGRGVGRHQLAQPCQRVLRRVGRHDDALK